MGSNQGYGQVHLPLTPVVKWLMIITVSVWIGLQLIIESIVKLPISYFLSLVPEAVITQFFIWQPLTYIFLHSNSVMHIVLNMLTLWFIGAELEQRWGRKFFLTYYLLSGVGAAIFYCITVGIYSSITGNIGILRTPVIGASGSIFGLLLAYGLLFGERTLHFMLLFPMKAKIFVLLLAGIEIVSLLSTGVAGSEVANLAHLGGFVAGFMVLLGYTRFQRFQWNQKSKKKGRNLRLVVDNENNLKTGDGPKYWN